MLAPQQIHFFSYATGVSLELPRGFVVATSDEASESYVLFDEEPDSERETVAAFVDVRTVAAIDSADDDYSAAMEAARQAVAAAVDAMGTHAAERRGRTWSEIDLEQVLQEEFHFPGGLPGATNPGLPVASASRAAIADFLTSDIAVIFAAVAFDGSLVTISAMAPSATMDAQRPIFAAALASARFIAAEGM